MVDARIETYVPKLPNIPGWVTFSEVEKTWLQERTSKALTAFRESGLNAITCCVEIAAVEKFLKGKAMTATDWMRTCFDRHERTARRWLANYREMVRLADEPFLLDLAEEGLAGVNNSLQPKELIAAFKAAGPVPKTADRKGRDSYRQKLSEVLRTRRSQRRKRVSLEISAEDAILAIVLKARLVLREAKLGSTAAEGAVLRKALGYTMMLRGIKSSITVEQMKIPDGFMPKVGRPRNPPPKH